MDQFIDRQYVCLRSSSGIFLHADEDWRGVSTRSDNSLLNTMWRVQSVSTRRGASFLLQGAAYGRYLAATDVKSERRPGRRGFRTEQRDFVDPDDPSVMWEAFGTVHRTVRIFSRLLTNGHLCLRADGIGVTIESATSNSPMIYWAVRPVPHSTINPQLSKRWTARLPGDQTLPLLGHSHQHENVEEEELREIRLTRMDRDDEWMVFSFAGRSLSSLRDQLALYLHEGVMYSISIRAGLSARLAPLVVDLPISSEPLTIVMTIFHSTDEDPTSTSNIVPGMIGKNMSGTGQQAQQKKPCTVTNNAHSDPVSSQSAETPVSGHKSVDIKIEATTSTEGVIRADSVSNTTSPGPSTEEKEAQGDELTRPKRKRRPSTHVFGDEWQT